MHRSNAAITPILFMTSPCGFPIEAANSVDRRYYLKRSVAMHVPLCSRGESNNACGDALIPIGGGSATQLPRTGEKSASQAARRGAQTTATPVRGEAGLRH